MTQLPPPPPAEWIGCDILSITPAGTSIRRRTGASAVTIPITNLVPGHRLMVTIEITTGAGGCVLSIGDTARRYYGPGPHTLTAPCTAAAHLDAHISGATTATVTRLTIDDATPMPAHPEPRHVLSLQAQYSPAWLTGLRLDTDRWDRASWTRGAPKPWQLVWNQTRWDTRAWDQETTSLIWQDITPHISSITTVRGVKADGPVITASVGTLTATSLGGLDPRATGIHHGTPVRLIHWPTRTRVFTGVITDLTVTPAKPRARIPYTVELTASDAVARAAAVKRYGARAEGGDGTETWAARVARVMRSAPDLAYTIPSTSYAAMRPIVWETSLAKHIDALAASVGGSWTVHRDNTIEITSARPGYTPALTLTDATDTDISAGIWSYSDIATAWSSSETISSITVTNHGAHIDDKGEWRADDTETTVTDPTATEAWAGSTAKVDMTLASGVTEAARALLRRATDLPIPSSVTLWACHEHGPADRARLMARAATLDPLTPARVILRSETSAVLITSIRHQITPTKWDTRLTLTPHR